MPFDAETLEAYDRGAADFCRLYRAIEPAPICDLIRALFIPGGSTADIGCGSGRDVAWLVRHGFPPVGYDPSRAMLEQAWAAYSELDLRMDSLPHLTTIP